MVCVLPISLSTAIMGWRLAVLGYLHNGLRSMLCDHVNPTRIQHRPEGSTVAKGSGVAELPAPAASRLRPPSWLDGRLIVGVVLVLVSVVVGAKVVASAGNYDRIWAASHDLASGVTLTKGDLVAVKVRFHDHGRGYYSASGPSLVGRTTTQPLAAGQLIPVAAAPESAPLPTRMVTVPVAKLHMPRAGGLAGSQVDMYVTPRTSSGTVASSELVLANVTVADTVTDTSLGSTGGVAVVLAVPAAYVDLVVSAEESGSIDLVLVPNPSTSASPSPGTFAPGGAAPDGSLSASPNASPNTLAGASA